MKKADIIKYCWEQIEQREREYGFECYQGYAQTKLKGAPPATLVAYGEADAYKDIIDLLD